MLDALLLSLPLMVTSILCFYLAMIVFARSAEPMKRSFIILLLALSFLSAIYCIELNNASEAEKLFWNDIEYVAMTVILPAIVLLVSEFLPRPEMGSPKRLLLLSIIPVISLLLVWTNDLHHLYYVSHELRPYGPFQIFSMTYGPGFWVLQAYTHLLLLGCVLIILGAYKAGPRPRRPQVRMVLLALVVPWLSNLLGQLGIVPLPSMYLTIMGFLIAGLLIYWAVFRYELLELMPLAMDKVIDGMPDAMLVLDRFGRLLFKNPAAVQLFGPENLRRGSKLTSLPFWQKLQGGGNVTFEESIQTISGVCTFSVQVSTLIGRNAAPVGTIVMMHDISSERATQEALRNANAKLNLLSSVTRHDVMNQLTAAMGHAQLLKLKLDDPEGARKHLNSLGRSLEVIEKQISFTRDYQEVGVRRPEWQSLRGVVDTARLAMPAYMTIRVIETDGIELFADPMLVKVFSNLFDNAVRHGSRTEHITIRTKPDGDRLDVIVEDDGVGVSDEDKVRIFELGYGKNTGMGLFICAQVLGITGMTIREDGTAGQGARFIIGVSPGQWRNT